MAPERVPAWQTPASSPLSGTRRATSCAAARTIIATPSEKDSLQPDGPSPALESRTRGCAPWVVGWCLTARCRVARSPIAPHRSAEHRGSAAKRDSMKKAHLGHYLISALRQLHPLVGRRARYLHSPAPTYTSEIIEHVCCGHDPPVALAMPSTGPSHTQPPSASRQSAWQLRPAS